ncbi:MAG: LysR family transcriptional regulator [Bacillota bacterium]
MRLAYKIWLDNNGKAFGEGPYELLARVEKTGSLNRAAAEMRMSYNKAWRLIRALEGRLGFPLLVRQVGGTAGGGSQVTPQGRRLMERYGALREDVQNTLAQLYEKHFQGMFLGNGK